MRTGWFVRFAGGLLAAGVLVPWAAVGQTSHAEAKAQVEARDKRHHDKLNTEGIPTATGAVAGGVVGGPAGAFTGAKVGHGVGAVFHGVKKHHDIKKIEKHGTPRSGRVHQARPARPGATAKQRKRR